MKDISSTELLYLVLFAAVVLGQYLIQWLRRGKATPQDEGQVETRQQTQHPVPDELPAMRSPAPVHFAPPPAPVPATHEGRPYGLVVFGRAPVSVPRRFSREALLGGKRRTQDAVVASVILGPCRAHLPHDNGQ